MIDKITTILLIWTTFSSFYLGQILSAVRSKICPLRLKFVESQQTIRTCCTSVMTENLFKLTTYRPLHRICKWNIQWNPAELWLIKTLKFFIWQLENKLS